MQRKLVSLLIFTALLAVMAAGVTLGVHQVLAEEGPTPEVTPSPMHPSYALLDADGIPVIRSGKPADMLKTCGQCHDAEFIATHATHTKAEGIARFEGMTEACFLCHSTQPNGIARQLALADGEKDWANTAVLLGTGVVAKTDDGWVWNPDAFWPDGKLKPAYVNITQPTNANCAQCHGVVHTDLKTPLVIVDPLDPDNWETLTTGQVFSPQRISASAMNIEGKAALQYAWDVHAERGLQCVDCHSSSNSPAARRYAELPDYLTYDPRHPSVGEYLEQPSHILTQENCQACHDPEASHKDWLPYLDLHMSKVACETCHVPKLYAPPVETYDRTVVMPDGVVNKVVLRGMAPVEKTPPDAPEVEPITVSQLITGYQPVLLKNDEGKIAPYNMVTTYEWVYEKDGKTVLVSDADLEKAWMPDGKTYASDIVAAFDADGDGKLSVKELTLDTQAKVDLIAKRLSDLGLKNPHIVGNVVPYAIHHSVVQSDYAIQDCRACHGSDSRIGKAIELSPFAPAGVTPKVDTSDIADRGQVVNESGMLYYQPEQNEALYVAGHSSVRWIDLLGILAFVGTLLGVLAHGAARVYFAKKLGYKHHHGPTKREYLYTAAERFWHWLQMVAILGLLFTGLIIHNPEWFGGFSFRGLVFTHTVLGWILVINFIFAAYYHLSTGYIKQYLPKPQGLFSRMILQAKFYAQGIFKGEPHPFKKTFWDKLNPMQRMAYFGLLFGMLPIQLITGVWIWAARIWPQAATLFGDATMTWVAAIHTLDAWMIGTFVVAHVYLTTTGDTPFAYIEAMITGWEDVEVDEEGEAAQAA